MEEGKKETRLDVLNRLFERLDRLEAIGFGEDVMINAEEAAAIACVEVNTVLSWGQHAAIPRYKLESCVRFGLREFCAWVASCRQPSLKEKKEKREEEKRQQASRKAG